MSELRILARLAAVATLCCGLALPAAADGLARFKEAVKDAPPGALTYQSAKALGDNGFELDDVVVKPPADAAGAKAEPVNIKRVVVEEFDFDAIDKNVPPSFARLQVEGIEVSGKPAPGVDLAKLAGIDKVTADFAFDYRLDPEHKTMTVKRFALDLKGLARIEFSMVLDGVTADLVNKPDAAMNDANLKSASLVFDDQSLLGKVVPAAAKMQGMEPAAMVAMGKAVLDSLRDGQGETTLAVLDAVESYMEDYHEPKGPLRVSLDPPGKTSAAALSAMKTPDEAIKALGLKVSYAGTRPQAPATPPSPEKPGPGKPAK